MGEKETMWRVAEHVDENLRAFHEATKQQEKREAEAEAKARQEEEKDEEVVALAEERAANDLICPISFGLLTDPVVASDGHAYQRQALRLWLARFEPGRATSPITGRFMHSYYVSSHNIKVQVRRLLDECRAEVAARRAKEKRERQEQRRQRRMEMAQALGLGSIRNWV